MNERDPEPAHKAGMPKNAQGQVLDEIELFLSMQLASRAVSAPLPQQIIELQNRSFFSVANHSEDRNR